MQYRLWVSWLPYRSDLSLHFNILRWFSIVEWSKVPVNTFKLLLMCTEKGWNHKAEKVWTSEVHVPKVALPGLLQHLSRKGLMQSRGHILYETKIPCPCLPNRQLVLQWLLHKTTFGLYMPNYYDISFLNLWSKVIFFFNFFLNSPFSMLFLGLELTVVLFLLEVFRCV